ncbi:MAB_1171c family putative transporter [Nocardia sp. NPDC050710]|uniref:MAB_1171c family putative transporter n=1 Tax=Nocardia sp. NPDC050710 TaxID=3157220 RepID=UPI0033D50A28
MWIPITGIIAWPVIGCLLAVTLCRLVIVRDTVIDQLINRLLMWFIVALLAYRCTFTPSLANQLALGSIVMMSAHLYTIARAVAPDADMGTVLRRQRALSLAAVVAAALILIAGTPARNEGRPVEFTASWEGFVIGTLFAIPLTIGTVAIYMTFVREVLFGDLSIGPRVVGYCIGLALNYAWITEVVGITQSFTGWPALGPQLPRIESAITLCGAVVAIVCAVPLVIRVISSAGLDRTGRHCRRLQPLWRDLTAAVPEIVLADESGAVDPDARLLRMTVEIRDAVLHLTPYFRVVPAAPGRSGVVQAESGRWMAEYALQLAHAAKARQDGASPTESGKLSKSLTLARDFDTDLEQLLSLARAWPTARAAAAG